MKRESSYSSGYRSGIQISESATRGEINFCLLSPFLPCRLSLIASIPREFLGSHTMRTTSAFRLVTTTLLLPFSARSMAASSIPETVQAALPSLYNIPLYPLQLDVPGQVTKAEQSTTLQQAVLDTQADATVAFVVRRPG